VLQEIRPALRRLSRTPALAAAVVLCTALGVGAVSAAFSAVQGVLLRPLPYRDPGRVVMIWERALDGSADHVVASWGNFVDWKAAAGRSFEAMAAYNIWFPGRTGVERPEKLLGAQVSAGFFEALRVSPRLGRAFTPADDLPNAPPVAILSDSYWRTRFGADRSAVGKTIELDGVSYEIVGVMGPGFRHPEPMYLQETTQLWRPLNLATPADPAQRSFRYLRTVARLRPGVSVESAAADLGGVARRLAAEYPESNEGMGVQLVPIHEELVGGYRKALLLLLAAAGLVLLIACANVSSLLLAAAAGRARETAVRTALGAGRGQLARQPLADALLLALAGGALGLLAGAWGVKGLVALTPQPMTRAEEIGVDGMVLAFTLGICLLAALLAGVGPALRAAAADPAAVLQEGGRRAAGGRRGGRLLGALVVLEIALSLPLLLGAGLLARSLAGLERIPLGFRSEGILTMRFELPPERYPGSPEMRVFYARLFEELKAVPGLQAAATTSSLPLSGLFDLTLQVGPPGPTEAITAGYRAVSPDYFAALGIPLAAGRGFGPGDGEAGALVAIVNRSLAQAVWPGRDPLGQTIDVASASGVKSRQVVGVVEDVRHAGPSVESGPEIFAPVLQSPVRFATLAVKTGREPDAVVPEVLAALRRVDPDLAVAGVRPLDDLVSAAVAAPRFRLVLAGTLAAVALLLAALGLYGLTSYTVGLRTREMGIRAALGASRGSLFGAVLGRSLGLALAGVVIGLAGAYALSRLLASLLYGVTPTDPATFVAAPLALLAVAAVAALLPARRAARVDPMIALREE
jgi:predicted permease